MTDVLKLVDALAGATAREEHADWVFDPAGPRAATLTVRLGATVGYADRIAYAAVRVPLARAKAGAPWARQDGESTVLWPLDAPAPTPADVMNWLQWHDLATLRDVVERAFGLDARGAGERACRTLVGYAYQTAWRGRRGLDAARSRARLRAAERCLRERVGDAEYGDRFGALAVHFEREGEGNMFGLGEQRESEVISDLIQSGSPEQGQGGSDVEKKSIVKKKSPAPAADAARGTKPTAGTKAKAKAAKPKAEKAAKPKAEAKPRASRLIVDPSTLKAPAGSPARIKDYVEGAKTLKVGDRRKYDGRNEALRGKTGVVVGFAADGSVFCDYPEVGRYMSTPFALGVPDPAKKAAEDKKLAAAAKKAAKAAAGKAGKSKK